MMKTIGSVSVIASVIIVMTITRTGSGPFLFMMAIAYGQQSDTNDSAIVGSTAPKQPLPVLLIHGYLSDERYGINGKICSKKMVSLHFL